MRTCDICGREAKARDIVVLKPESEWETPGFKEYEYIDVCCQCSTSLLWHTRYAKAQYDDDKKKGVTNAEIDKLLGNDDALDG